MPTDTEAKQTSVHFDTATHTSLALFAYGAAMQLLANASQIEGGFVPQSEVFRFTTPEHDERSVSGYIRVVRSTTEVDGTLEMIGILYVNNEGRPWLPSAYSRYVITLRFGKYVRHTIWWCDDREAHNELVHKYERHLNA